MPLAGSTSSVANERQMRPRHVIDVSPVASGDTDYFVGMVKLTTNFAIVTVLYRGVPEVAL